MSKKLGLVGRLVSLSTPSLVVGSDAFVVTQVVFHGSGEPYSMPGYVGATAFFPAATGGSVTSVGTLEAQDLGTVRFPLPAANSVALLAGDAQSFYQTFRDARGATTIIFNEALDIVASPF